MSNIQLKIPEKQKIRSSQFDLEKTKKTIFINIKISNDSEIKKLNKKYLGKDNVTDVLSFGFEKLPVTGELSGDIIVNKDQAKRQSGKYGNTLEQEIAELIEHGVLHLFGIHHDGDNH